MTLRKLAICLLPIIPLTLGAESLSYKGQVKTKLPNVSIATSADPVSDVKEFTLTPSNNAGICNLSNDESVAANHSTSYRCLIKWDVEDGIAQDSLKLRGVTSGAGLKTFNYSLSLFSDGEYHPFFSGKKEVLFSEPIAPDSPNTISRWAIKSDSESLTHKLLNRNESLSSVSFTVPSRNYNQVVHFNGKTCTVLAYKNTCEIITNKTFIAETEPQGSDVLPFYVSDPYNFFNSGTKDFAIDWDFRPSEIVNYYVNTQDTRLPMIVNDYGEPIVVMPDQAAVVVRSPHAMEEGDWWYPTDPTLHLKISDGFNMTNTITYADKPVTFDLNLFNPESTFTSTPIDKPLKVNEYLVYIYDFRTVQDGMYDFTISTKDINDNGDTEVLEDIFVDRMPPDLQFVLNNKQHTGSLASVYSISDITALAWGGWEDGTEIFEASINGEPVTFSGGLDNVRRLDKVDLPINSKNTLLVKARDAIGNEIFKELDFNFAQYQFTHKSAETMRVVEPAAISLLQTQGLRCIFASSPELASVYSADTRFRGCTIEWQQLPPGMEPTLPTARTMNFQNIASGAMTDEGSYPYSFTIKSYDIYGEPLEIYNGEGNLDILPIQPPTLTAGYPHIVTNFGYDYINSKAANRPLVIPYRVEKSQYASITVQVLDESDAVVFERVHSRKEPMTISQAVANDIAHSPLQVENYNVRAYYTAYPDEYSEKPFKLFNTPSTGVRLYTDHERTLLENTQFQVFANIAELQNGVHQYSPDMGEWDVYLATFKNGDFIPVTEKVRVDQNGEAIFEVNANDFANDDKIQTVADLVTPYPEVKSRLVSNSLMSVNVLRLSGISAQLTTPEVSLPVPARFLIRADLQERIDRMSTRQIIWQTSVDGQNWESVSTGNSQSYSIFMEEPSSVYVRAAMEHIQTRELSFTNALMVTGYNQASIELSGHSQVVAGALADFYHTVSDYTLQQAVGQVEWSLDDQSSWIPMAQHERVSIDSDKIITARLLVHNDDPAEPDYYVYDSVHVKAIPPVLLRPIVSRSASKLEIGESVSFKASFRPQPYYAEDQIRYQYVKPDGSTVSDLVLEHTLTVDDFKNLKAGFKFQAWVDGLKEQTITTVDLTIDQNIYTFPASTLKLYSNSRVINSPFLATINAAVSGAPSTVEFTAEWELPPGIEVVRTYPGNRSISIQATQPGVHNIKATFKDNRGGYIEHNAFVEAIDPPPMKLELSAVASNEYMRPPLNYSVRSKAWPGHSRDYVTTYKWQLNGEEVEDASSFMNRFEFTEPGKYQVTLTAETLHGQQQTESIEVEVVPNKKPTCEPFTEVRSATLVVHANCSDEDGVITKVHYAFTDYFGIERVLQSYSQILIFQLEQYPSVKVDITAFDDSSDSVETSVNYVGN